LFYGTQSTCGGKHKNRLWVVTSHGGACSVALAPSGPISWSRRPQISAIGTGTWTARIGQALVICKYSKSLTSNEVRSSLSVFLRKI
jgi:hypothetical protein